MPLQSSYWLQLTYWTDGALLVWYSRMIFPCHVAFGLLTGGIKALFSAKLLWNNMYCWKKRKEKEWGEYSQCGFSVWFFEQGWVCASRLSSIIGGSEEKDFIILWSNDARQAVQCLCVKMPTRLSCFIMPAGGSSTMSASSWRVMDRGRKESHKSSLLRHKSNPSLFSIFCIGSLFSRFHEFAFLCLSFHVFLRSSKHICSPFFSRLSSPSTNTRLSTWNKPVTLGRMLIWVQIMLLVTLWDSCNLKSSAENRLWIAAWICCNKSQTRSGPSAISQAPDRDYSVQKPSAHTSSQPKTTGCIS